MNNESNTHKVIKDFGYEARIGDTCVRSGGAKRSAQFHSDTLFDSAPVYNAEGELITYMSESREITYWVEWLKTDEIDLYLETLEGGKQ